MKTTLRGDLWRLSQRFFFRMKDDAVVLAARRIHEDPTEATSSEWCADVRLLCDVALGLHDLHGGEAGAWNAATRVKRMSDDQLLDQLALETRKENPMMFRVNGYRVCDHSENAALCDDCKNELNGRRKVMRHAVTAAVAASTTAAASNTATMAAAAALTEVPAPPDLNAAIRAMVQKVKQRITRTRTAAAVEANGIPAPPDLNAAIIAARHAEAE